MLNSVSSKECSQFMHYKVLGKHLHIIYMCELSNTDTFKRLQVQHESRAIQ